LNNIKN